MQVKYGDTESYLDLAKKNKTNQLIIGFIFLFIFILSLLFYFIDTNAINKKFLYFFFHNNIDLNNYWYYYYKNIAFDNFNFYNIHPLYILPSFLKQFISYYILLFTESIFIIYFLYTKYQSLQKNKNASLTFFSFILFVPILFYSCENIHILFVITLWMTLFSHNKLFITKSSKKDAYYLTRIFQLLFTIFAFLFSFVAGCIILFIQIFLFYKSKLFTKNSSTISFIKKTLYLSTYLLPSVLIVFLLYYLTYFIILNNNSSNVLSTFFQIINSYQSQFLFQSLSFTNYIYSNITKYTILLIISQFITLSGITLYLFFLRKYKLLLFLYITYSFTFFLFFYFSYAKELNFLNINFFIWIIILNYENISLKNTNSLFLIRFIKIFFVLFILSNVVFLIFQTHNFTFHSNKHLNYTSRQRSTIVIMDYQDLKYFNYSLNKNQKILFLKISAMPSLIDKFLEPNNEEQKKIKFQPIINKKFISFVKNEINYFDKKSTLLKLTSNIKSINIIFYLHSNIHPTNEKKPYSRLHLLWKNWKNKKSVQIIME